MRFIHYQFIIFSNYTPIPLFKMGTEVKKEGIATIFILFFLLASQVHAKVTLTADRTVLNQNESINIEITQSDVSGGNPDVSLLKKDFEILSQSQSQQYNMINGRTSQKKVWSLSLMPKSTGEIIIPSIQIGQESTLPLHLVIKKAKQNNADDQTEQVFMQVSVNPKNKAYVQQKIELVIQIYYRINLNNLALSDINIENVILEKFGEDKQYTKNVKQHTYQVIERRYAIYPQKSGPITIPSIRFEGVIINRGNSGSGSWPFFTQRGKTIHKASSPINIEILAKPEQYPGKDWLPAENIQVASEHSDLSNINIGDSITITDKIIAKGLSGSVLSDIPFDSISGIKVYPDQAKVNSQERQGVLYGLREQKTALIPTRSGRFEIPARKLVWWNIKTDRLETKIIPGISFNVLPAQEQPAQNISEKVIEPSPSGITSPLENKTNNINQADKAITNKNENVHSEKTEVNLTKQLVNQLLAIENNVWFWIWCLSILVFSVILKTVHNKRVNIISEVNEQAEEEMPESLLPQLIHEMKYDNPKRTYDLFIQWMKQEVLKNNSNIADFKALITHQGLKKAFIDLETYLFSTNTKYDSWKAKDLHQALKKFIKENNKLHPGRIHYIPELNG
ncbi:MAG: protein BatD [Gammaproteobacteria bacterium]|nr:protein BatD [Gammaproteobacteria bacterium]